MNSKKTIAVVLASGVLVITGVVVSQDQSDESSSPADVHNTVLARLAEIQEAAQALDPDKVFGFVMENDDGALAQSGKLFLTREEALEFTKQGFRGLQRVSYHFNKHHVTLLSPTIALAIGEGESSATLEDGRVLDADFVQSVVLVLTNGEWMVFHSHRSSPPAQ